jgi:hypothetical protein
MDAAEGWRHVFKSWPAGYPKSGIIVTSFQETIPFCNFMISDAIVLLERDRPDSLGARKAMVAFSAISALKLTDVFELSKFEAFGFKGAGPGGK